MSVTSRQREILIPQFGNPQTNTNDDDLNFVLPLPPNPIRSRFLNKKKIKVSNVPVLKMYPASIVDYASINDSNSKINNANSKNKQHFLFSSTSFDIPNYPIIFIPKYWYQKRNDFKFTEIFDIEYALNMINNFSENKMQDNEQKNKYWTPSFNYAKSIEENKDIFKIDHESFMKLQNLNRINKKLKKKDGYNYCGQIFLRKDIIDKLKQRYGKDNVFIVIIIHNPDNVDLRIKLHDDHIFPTTEESKNRCLQIHYKANLNEVVDISQQYIDSLKVLYPEIDVKMKNEKETMSKKMNRPKLGNSQEKNKMKMYQTKSTDPFLSFGRSPKNSINNAKF